MLIETRAITPIQHQPVRVTPTRSKNRFENFHKKNLYQRIQKKALHEFDSNGSFEKEEIMYDGHSRTILFQLGHIGSIIDLYV